MMQGVCVDVGLSSILEEGRTYFLRDHGSNNYYVGNFDNPESYFGSFRKELFILESVVEARLRLKHFVARVSEKHTWFTVGDEYIITEKDHSGYIHVYSKKSFHLGPIGSYLSDFFEVIEPFEIPGKKVTPEKNEALETVPEVVPEEQSVTLVQMDLFEFIDV